MEPRKKSFAGEWNSVYFFIPLFEAPIQMPSLEVFLDALAKKFGKVEPMAKTPKMPSKPEDILGIALLEHQAYYEKDKLSMPSQLMLCGPDAFDQGQWDERILSQFWDCTDRQDFVERCRYSIMANNFMAATLPKEEQYQIIADYADLILELFPECIGIYWPHSQKLISRERFSEPHWNNDRLHFLDGGLNVRFFRINGTDEMLFDTLGLTAIGLPDLQCHCKDLEPDEVVCFLQNLAVYLYENGDIIEDGNTVEGIDHGKWRCRHEDAMIEPLRVVLDVCPGKYAGGGRE